MIHNLWIITCEASVSHKAWKFPIWTIHYNFSLSLGGPLTSHKKKRLNDKGMTQYSLVRYLTEFSQKEQNILGVNENCEHLFCCSCQN